MKNKDKKKRFSHNFLRNPQLVQKLVSVSKIGKGDLVLEIGPGKGAITRELVKVAGKVVAVELDEYFFNILKKEFYKQINITLINKNFLNLTPPARLYKVFSNIPFSITSDIIKKLTTDKNFQEGYLIVQKEAAHKFVGKSMDGKNSMQSVLLKPWFEISIIWEFSPWDFVPKPNVEIVTLKIVRRETPLLPYKHRSIYRDFIYVLFNQHKTARYDFNYILRLFNNHSKNSGPDMKKIYSQKARKIMQEQDMIHKIHRTRKDKNWRMFE